MTDLILLASLFAGPRHGYALKKQAGMLFADQPVHNNLVYPLLRRFTENGWVAHKAAKGLRGQTREVYSITAKGRAELLRRLAAFGEKEAASEAEFRLRVGLFALLEPAARLRILAERERRLAARDARCAHLEENVNLGEWGGEVVRFLRRQTRREREWIASLEAKAKRGGRRSGERGKA
jgi:DNA-binding PadR family transcriptional regulator